MFEDALLESSNRIKTRSKYWSLVAFVMNCGALVALILWPLLHPEALPIQVMAALLVAPAPPPPPPPQVLQPRVNVRSEILENELQAPNKIPTEIKIAREVAQASMVGMEQMADGTPGNGMSGIFGSIGQGHTAVVTTIRPTGLNISSGVMAGYLIVKIAPQYPAIAKAVRIQGTVVLQATISKAGTIENLRVINGSPMLQQAAIDAVRSWRYRPYLLNAEPVEVETTVNVVFSLGG
jgi:periplasmic protein TonB